VRHDISANPLFVEEKSSRDGAKMTPWYLQRVGTHE
jgi:hypothetical protein